MIRKSDGTVVGVGGLRLAYRTWEPASARAALVLVHGLGEHSGRYAEFGTRMANFGIAVYAMDLRGHGLSEGRRGHVPAFRVYLQELDRFRREIEDSGGPRLPLFVLGHSMGGLIALRYQEEYSDRFRGAVVVSPWLATAMPVPRLTAAAANLFSRLLPALPFRTGLRAEHLSRDTDVVEAYRSDPLVHGVITPRLFTEASIAMGLALQRSDRIRDPLLFMLAGDDRIVDSDKSVRFTRGIRAGDTTVRVFPGEYHELLHEIGRADTHRIVKDWIVERL